MAMRRCQVSARTVVESKVQAQHEARPVTRLLYSQCFSSSKGFATVKEWISGIVVSNSIVSAGPFPPTHHDSQQQPLRPRHHHPPIHPRTS